MQCKCGRGGCVSDHGPVNYHTKIEIRKQYALNDGPEHGFSMRDHARACLTLDMPSTQVLVSFSQVSISTAAYS